MTKSPNSEALPPHVVIDRRRDDSLSVRLFLPIGTAIYFGWNFPYNRRSFASSGVKFTEAETIIERNGVRRTWRRRCEDEYQFSEPTLGCGWIARALSPCYGREGARRLSITSRTSSRVNENKISLNTLQSSRKKHTKKTYKHYTYLRLLTSEVVVR